MHHDPNRAYQSHAQPEMMGPYRDPYLLTPVPSLVNVPVQQAFKGRLNNTVMSNITVDTTVQNNDPILHSPAISTGINTSQVV